MKNIVPMINLNQQVVCGIVLYNPNISELTKNINIYLRQFENILLVDNNSKNIKDVMDRYKNNPKVKIICNSKNEGIAHALNQIMEFALKNSFNYFITMDQDTEISPNFLGEYEKNIDELKNFGILMPYLLNNNKITLDEYHKLDLSKYTEIVSPIKCITSGCLVDVKKAAEIGGYNSKMFIDFVDTDFNIRMLEHYKIYQINSAYIIQKMGVGKEVKIIRFLYNVTGSNLMKKLQVTPVYNNMRLYYMARNSRYIRKKYKKRCGPQTSFLWMIGQFLYYIMTYPMNISRLNMVKSIFKGWLDADKIERA